MSERSSCRQIGHDFDHPTTNSGEPDLRSNAKYTIVVWRDGGKPAEAVVRTPLKELADQLDANQFVQIQRSVVVNLRAVSHVKRHDNETAELHVKGRNDVLPVSRNYLHLFRQM